MSEIKNKYAIDFTSVDGRKVSGSRYSKYSILVSFFNIWNDPREIRETLLPAVNAAVAGEVDFSDVDADVVGVALIYKDRIKFCSSQLGFDDLVIPPMDFQILINEWLYFLEN